MNLGWYGSVRVDGHTFAWLGGNVIGGVNNTAIESAIITPTRSNFIILAGPVRLNVTFLSPIEVCLLSRLPMKVFDIIIWIAGRHGQTVSSIHLPMCISQFCGRKGSTYTSHVTGLVSRVVGRLTPGYPPIIPRPPAPL